MTLVMRRSLINGNPDKRRTRMLKQGLWVILIAICLAGCTTPAMKAPCNWKGTNCGPKIKINEWDNV